jgi:hypothetical protein
MIFSRKPGRRLRHAAGGLAVLAMLAGCGGGTTQYDPFVPQRLMAFGDETSAFTAAGQKYSINGIQQVVEGGQTVEKLDCQALPNWVQSMAGFYGFVFAECNTANATEFKATNLSVAGALADDIKVQIDAQIANGGFRDKDIVTVLAGANDVIALYQLYPGVSEDDLANELRARGERLALQVNRLVELGAKVILSTVPDMGLTPYARRQRNAFRDTDRAALLTRLTAAFNEQLGINIILDGRYIGLVQADLRVQQMVRNPASFALTNTTDAACEVTTPPPECLTTTLVSGATASSWLWADELRLSYAGQAQLGALAVDRARRNPF